LFRLDQTRREVAQQRWHVVFAIFDDRNSNLLIVIARTTLHVLQLLSSGAKYRYRYRSMSSPECGGIVWFWSLLDADVPSSGSLRNRPHLHVSPTIFTRIYGAVHIIII